MITYKFEKGTIRTGMAIDIGTNDQKFFEDNFGKFIEYYNDMEHSDEELEFVYAFVEVSGIDEDDMERKLILTKDKVDIDRMMLDEMYELAFMDEVEAIERDKPINFICEDGCCSLVIEEYIRDGIEVCRSDYISVSWI